MLLDLLPQVEESAIKEGIVRALTVTEAQSETTVLALLNELQKLPEAGPPWLGHLKFAFGNALTVVAVDALFPEIEALLRDRTQHSLRVALVEALGHLSGERARRLAVELLADDDTARGALIAVRQLKAVEALAKVQELRGHPNEQVRNQAVRTEGVLRRALGNTAPEAE